MRRLSLPILIQLLTVAGGAYAGPATGPGTDPVTKEDFFFYSCVREYMQTNSIRIFDGSVGYAVERSDLDPEELNSIYQAAKTYAQGIWPPDYSDPEHGLPAVLALCRYESKKEVK